VITRRTEQHPEATPVAFAVMSLMVLVSSSARAENVSAEPAKGILLKPIPGKLVVLTFDDGCASHATVVAPILKSLGFGGTFYVSDFGSFHTRKDWYLTWRQMRSLAADGFEIGNHSRGHPAFSSHNVEGGAILLLPQSRCFSHSCSYSSSIEASTTWEFGPPASLTPAVEFSSEHRPPPSGPQRSRPQAPP